MYFLIYRYQQVVGTMVIMDILSTNTHDIKSFKKLFEDSIQEGHIGWLVVAPEGFELHTMKGLTLPNKILNLFSNFFLLKTKKSFFF